MAIVVIRELSVLSEKVLLCPVCKVEVKDSDFASHLVQAHADVQGRVRGSYGRWLEDMRVRAGGELHGSGEGRGLFNV